MGFFEDVIDTATNVTSSVSNAVGLNKAVQDLTGYKNTNDFIGANGFDKLINSHLDAFDTMLGQQGMLSYKNGSVQYDKSKDYASHWLTEGIGELNGSNAARKQQMLNQDAADAEIVQKKQQMRQEQDRQYNLDKQASTSVGLATRAANNLKLQYLGLSGSSYGDPSKDFLGL